MTVTVRIVPARELDADVAAMLAAAQAQFWRGLLEAERND